VNGDLAHRLSGGLRGPPFWIAAGGMMWSAAVGVGLAAHVPIGLALLVGPAYGLILFANLSLALVLWVPLVFLDSATALSAAGKAAGLLIALVWLGSLRSLPETAIAALRRHRLLLATLAALIAWLTFSLAWSTDPGRGLSDLWRWYVLAALFLVVLTTATTAQLARLILGAFIAGALASVVIGVLNGGLSNALNGGARFAGIGGDPNVLAAGLLPATVLAAAFLPGARSPLARSMLIAAITLLVAGFLATASRGGFVAALATIFVALMVFSRRRAQVVAVAAVILGVAGVTLASSPQTRDRLTNYKDDNGRADLRTVAWRMAQTDPVAGVGINNFEVHSPQYVREPGALTHVGLIVDEPTSSTTPICSCSPRTGLSDWPSSWGSSRGACALRNSPPIASTPEGGSLSPRWPVRSCWRRSACWSRTCLCPLRRTRGCGCCWRWGRRC